MGPELTPPTLTSPWVGRGCCAWWQLCSFWMEGPSFHHQRHHHHHVVFSGPQLSVHVCSPPSTVYSCSADGTVLAWNASSLRVTGRFQVPGGGLSAIRPHGGRLWCCKCPGPGPCPRQARKRPGPFFRVAFQLGLQNAGSFLGLLVPTSLRSVQLPVAPPSPVPLPLPVTPPPSAAPPPLAAPLPPYFYQLRVR